MNRILSATKLDFYASKSMLKLISLLVLLGVVIGVVTHGPDYMMMFIMVFGVTSSGSVFSMYEKSHSDKLFGVLPLKKSDMVLGRYLYALIIGVCYIVVGAILGLAMSLVMDGRVNALSYWATLAVAFCYYSFATGVAYPVYYKFTFAKAYIFTMIPMYVIVVAYLILTRRTDITATLAQASQFFGVHIYLLPIFGLVTGLAIFATSATIAQLIYSHKEL